MKKFQITIIFIVLLLIATNLCGCIDPYAAYRYPTAKEAVEASGEYTITKIYGEIELNGIICFFYKASKASGGNEPVSCTLVKNENGYCMVDKFERAKAASYTEDNVLMIVYRVKFNKHIIEIYFQNHENEPIVTDSIQSNSVVIPQNKIMYEAYLVLDKIPANYKICVDGIWYPLPQSLLEIFDEIPPQ